jgi:hypothetical protein
MEIQNTGQNTRIFLKKYVTGKVIPWGDLGHVSLQQQTESSFCNNERPVSKHETVNKDYTPHHRRTKVTAKSKGFQKRESI